MPDVTGRRIAPLRIFWLLAFALVRAATPAVQAQGIVVLEPSGQWVTDRGDMLSASEERSLTERLRAYADTTSTQIVVVTLPDLDGADIGLYATELGQRWRVGQDGKDNGAVILVSRDDRQVFIATGYGLEGAIPDAVAGRIVRDIITPNFRQGAFYAGLAGAADALMLAAAGEYTADSPSPGPSDGGGVDDALIFVIVIILYFVFSQVRRRGGGGGRRRGGPIIWGGGGFGGGGGGGFGGGGFGGGGGGFGGGGAGGSW